MVKGAIIKTGNHMMLCPCAASCQNYGKIAVCSKCGFAMDAVPARRMFNHEPDPEVMALEPAPWRQLVLRAWFGRNTFKQTQKEDSLTCSEKSNHSSSTLPGRTKQRGGSSKRSRS